MFERRIFFAVFQIKCCGKFFVSLLVCSGKFRTSIDQVLYAGSLVIRQEVHHNRIGFFGQVHISIVDKVCCLGTIPAKGTIVAILKLFKEVIVFVVGQIQLYAKFDNRGIQVRHFKVTFEADHLVFHRLFVCFFNRHERFFGRGEQVLEKHLAIRSEVFIKIHHRKFGIIATLEVLPDFFVDVFGFCFLSRLNRDTHDNMLLVHLGEVLVLEICRKSHLAFDATAGNSDNHLRIFFIRLSTVNLTSETFGQALGQTLGQAIGKGFLEFLGDFILEGFHLVFEAGI